MRALKYSYLGYILATLFGYVMASQGMRASAMGIDQFHWGEPSCEGISVGIAIEKNIANEPIVYHVALANRSASSRQITLFSMVPGLYRLRVIGRQGAKEESAPALYSQLQISNPQSEVHQILAPGQIFQRLGDLTRFRGHLSGAGTLHIEFSSLSVRHDAPHVDDEWCHVKSPEVKVQF
jgi:hypothetical protein